MRVVFAGTPEFASAALRALHEAGFEIPLVLTQPDRPAGRGMQLQASSVKQYAVAHGIPVLQPVSLRTDSKIEENARQAQAAVAQLQATPHDVMVVAAYGLILPRQVLDIPARGCINIHGSLLPRWRGAAPIHRAIEAGDTQTGITIMQMEEGLDTGPMLLKTAVDIGPQHTTGALHDELAALGADMIVQALRQFDSLRPQVQPEDGVTYAAKISKDEAALDWHLDAETLARKVRAFNPFPGAVAQFDGTPIKIWRAETAPASLSAKPGELIAADPEYGVIVACNGGALRLLELQKPGGKRLPASEFLKGYDLSALVT
ncbi:MAG TPA: methionyl-tRNA formyltransferase [Burkholderiaceae bacterium]